LNQERGFKGYDNKQIHQNGIHEMNDNIENMESPHVKPVKRIIDREGEIADIPALKPVIERKAFRRCRITKETEVFHYWILQYECLIVILERDVESVRVSQKTAEQYSEYYDNLLILATRLEPIHYIRSNTVSVSWGQKEDKCDLFQGYSTSNSNPKII
jgi:hypothetical protein